MGLEQFVGAVCLAMVLIGTVGYRHLSEHVWLRYSGWKGAR